MPKVMMKFQRAVKSTEPGAPPILVYNEDRSQLFNLCLDERTEAMVFALNPYKVYGLAEVVDGVLQMDIDSFTDQDQGW